MLTFTNQGIEIYNYQITLEVVIQSIIIILLAIALNIGISVFINKKIKSTKNRHQRNILYSISYIKKYVIFISAILAILQIFGVSLTWLIASSAALVVAFGLGLQQIVSNYMSGATLIFSEWLSIGDVIKIEGKTGKITKIGLRNTHLITPLGENIIIPNARFLNDIVYNWSGGSRQKLLEVSVGISYETDLEKAQNVLIESIKNLPNIDTKYEPIVF